MSRLNGASESTAFGNRDTTVIKVDTSRSPHGPMGEKYLASGVHLAMRLWESVPASTESETERERDYEIVGYVIGGRAQLHIEGQMVLLETGSLVRRPARRMSLLPCARSADRRRGHVAAIPRARSR